jgi:hypothetical protein
VYHTKRMHVAQASVHDVQQALCANPPAALLSCRGLLLSEDGRSSRIPGFWLHVLRSTEPGALAITRRDAAVLSQLADVRCSMVLPKAVDSRGLTEVTVACEWGMVAGEGVKLGCACWRQQCQCLWLYIWEAGVKG